MSQTILITGGAGYIGSHVVYAALERGYQVIAVDDLSTGRHENLPPDLPFHMGDVGDRKFINQILATYRPETVLHFAGSIIVSESLSFPEKYYRNNTAASIVLAEACLNQNIKNFVFSSSAAVYGEIDGGLATEETPTKPITPYGWSKLMTEQTLEDLSRAHGMTFAALRYFNVAGADQKGRTGQSSPQATHLIKLACQTAVGIREHLSVFGTDYPTPDGTCIRDYIHVSDLAEAHLYVMEHIKKTRKSVRLNCGNGQGYSVRQVIDAVEKVVGRKLQVIDAPRRFGDPAALVADVARINSIGWRAQHLRLETMIDDALAWEARLQAEQQKNRALM